MIRPLKTGLHACTRAQMEQRDLSDPTSKKLTLNLVGRCCEEREVVGTAIVSRAQIACDQKQTKCSPRKRTKIDRGFSPLHAKFSWSIGHRFLQRRKIKKTLESHAPKGRNPVPGRKGCAEAVAASSASDAQRYVIAIGLTIASLPQIPHKLPIGIYCFEQDCKSRSALGCDTVSLVLMGSHAADTHS